MTKLSVRIAGFRAEILTRDFPDTQQEYTMFIDNNNNNVFVGFF
jgi:hypothetical protein